VANKAYFGANYTWVMICAFMVFFFQCGFAMVETGFCRRKNAAHTMTMNFMVFLVGAVGYFLTGLRFRWAAAAARGPGTAVLNAMLTIPGLGGILGYKGFLLGGTYDAGVYAMFFFQMVFMDTTVTIPTGAMAERVKYSAVVITSFFISMFFYPVFACWVWGGGWLSTLGVNFGIGHGVVDFRGLRGGALHGRHAGAGGRDVIGPRIGKFKKDGTARAFPGHDIPMAIIGTIILFFCWFAFNASSTLNASDLRLTIAATNTMISGAVGGLVAMFYMWVKYGKPDPSMTANGALAGLVAITAPCAFVNGWSACIIGIVSAFLVCNAVPFVENKLKLDDPVGAISVHCVNGVWGVLATGLFADGTYGDGWNGVAGNVRGLFYGDASQFLAQLIAVAVLIVWGFGGAYLFFKVLDKVWGLRVAPEQELDGLDIPEMGVLAYPDNQLLRTELDYSSADNAPIPQLARFGDFDPASSVPMPAAPVPAARAVPVVDVSSQAPASDMRSASKLTKIDIILKQSRFEALKEAMNEIGVTGMTVTQVLGCGIQKGATEYYRGVATEISTCCPRCRWRSSWQRFPVRLVVDTARKVFTPATSATARSSSTTWRTPSRCAPARRATTRCRATTTERSFCRPASSFPTLSQSKKRRRARKNSAHGAVFFRARFSCAAFWGIRPRQGSDLHGLVLADDLDQPGKALRLGEVAAHRGRHRDDAAAAHLLDKGAHRGRETARPDREAQIDAVPLLRLFVGGGELLFCGRPRSRRARSPWPRTSSARP
jgi:Amt family ammonium transporter